MLTKHQDCWAKPSHQLSWSSLIFPSLLGGMTTSTATASVLYAVGQNVEIARLLAGVVPGMAIGVLVNLLLKQSWIWQNQLQIIEACQAECAAKRLNQKVNGIGEAIMNVIEAHTQHKDDLYTLFQRSISDRVIPNVSPALLSAKFERLDNLESRLQADLDNICETFNVVRHSVKFGKWRTTP